MKQIVLTDAQYVCHVFKRGGWKALLLRIDLS